MTSRCAIDDPPSRPSGFDGDLDALATLDDADGVEHAFEREPMGDQIRHRHVAGGEVPVADLITHRLPLEGVLDAIGIVSRGEGIKVTIEP